jgi:hypothetical protein
MECVSKFAVIVLQHVTGTRAGARTSAKARGVVAQPPPPASHSIGELSFRE